MKINRFVALSLIALLVVGAMGAISYRVFARSGAIHSSQTVLTTQDCSQDQADGTESHAATDTDNVDLQCGDQNALDVKEATGAQEATDEGESKDGAEAAPTGTPAISADQARTAALAVHPGTVSKTELDDENGQLVYSVQFSDSTDVKVDAMTGQVVTTETEGD